MSKNDLREYLVGGGNLKAIPLMLTLVASQLGGGALLGVAEHAYQRGWEALFYPLGGCLGLVIIAFGFGSALRKLNITSFAQVFEKIYDSFLLRKIAALISVVSLFFILVAQGVAAKFFFSYLNYTNPIFILGFWLIIIGITMRDGFNSIVKFDKIFLTFICLVFTILFVLITNASNNMELSSFEIKTETPAPLMRWIFIPMIFTLIGQDVGQRCFASDGSKSITFACLGAALLRLLIVSVPAYLGIHANRSGIDIPAGASAFFLTVNELTHPIFGALIFLGIFMAIISTANSLLCSITTNISSDLLNVGRQENLVRNAKLITILVGLAAGILSMMTSDIISILILAYEFSVVFLFVPLIMSVVFNRPSVIAAYASMLISLILFVICKIYSDLPYGEVITIIISSAVYLFFQLQPQQVRST